MPRSYFYFELWHGICIEYYADDIQKVAYAENTANNKKHGNKPAACCLQNIAGTCNILQKFSEFIGRKRAMALEYMDRFGLEELVFCHDRRTGLKAIIAIHDTTLGPAMGGTRMKA